MTDPLALFLTWTTYGTWLPGDERGSRERGGRFRPPDARLRDDAARIMTENPCELSRPQRAAVEAVVRRHCEIQGWRLYAVNARSNHVHAVVVAPDVPPKKVREELKSWATRTLKRDDETGRRRWWSDGGDVTFLFTDAAVTEKVDYVLNRQ